MDVIIKAIPEPEVVRSAYLVTPVFSDGKLSKVAKRLDRACGGVIHQLVKRGDIKGELSDTLLLPTVTGINADRILLLGCGSGKQLSESDFIKLLKTALAQLSSGKNACLLFDELTVSGHNDSWMAKQIAICAGNNNYRYSKTLSKPAPQPELKRITIAQSPSKALRAGASQGTAIALGMNTARELGNLPGNICTPSYLAKQARALAKKHSKLNVSVLDEKQMKQLGMGSMLSVSAGSDQPAKLIVMEYKGAAKEQKPHALVGKGITFDSGGISIKPGARMDEMKYDMCGAASVIGTMTTLLELDLAINVVAIIAAAENMPNGSATKPGDVVTSMSGKTIEVLNTDAEGRLILCDALSYAAKFKPQSVIDIATLTGACVVALGKHASALYSNADDFAAELIAAGQQSGDRAWHMPLWDEYQQQLKSNFADIANIGGPEAGSVTAACFLSRFTENMRWAHLDIAGTAWLSGNNKGATGRPVALLSQYLIDKSISEKRGK